MDQRNMWNSWHVRHDAKDDMQLHMRCRSEFLGVLPKPDSAGRILELGCGQGYDSTVFAEAGYSVEALDFSDVAIDIARKKLAASPPLGINYVCRDISLPLPYDDSTFSGVYSYLSLHYFRLPVTRNIFDEIARVTSEAGFLCFSVRSVTDALFREGRKVDYRVYERNGHIRRFFDEDEIRELLQDHWTVISLQTGRGHYLSMENPEASVLTALAVRKK